jgi:hypothetical protein
MESRPAQLPPDTGVDAMVEPAGKGQAPLGGEVREQIVSVREVGLVVV